MNRPDTVDVAAPVRRRSRTEVALLAVIAVAGGGLLGALVLGASGGPEDKTFPPPPPPAAAPPPAAPLDGAGSFVERLGGHAVRAVSVEFEYLNSYTDVSICAVGEGGLLRCVGHAQWPGLDGVPSDAMREVRVSETGACGVTVDGELVCWGTYELRVRPEVTYETFVASSYFDVCLLDVAGRVVCHSLHLKDDPDWAERRPEHPVLFQADASRHASAICGVSATGEPTCFGQFSPDIEQRELLPPPDLRLRSVHVGQEAACGIALEGEIVCWGARHAVFRELPSGPFVDLTINSQRLCGLRADGTVACTRHSGPDRRPPANLRFRTIALATGIQNLLCGVTLEGELACWVPGEEGLLASEILGELRKALQDW